MAIIDGVSVSGTTYRLRDNDTSGGIASTFSTSTAYTAGQYVWYDSGSGAKLYRFTVDHAAGAWTGTDATEVKLGNDVSALKSAITSLEFSETDPFDLSGLTTYDYIISPSTGKWATSSDYSSWIVSRPEKAEILVITGGTDNSVIAMLTSNAHTAGTTPSYATGWTGRKTITSGETVSLAIPADCKYIWVNGHTSSTNDYTPAYIGFDGEYENIVDNIVGYVSDVPTNYIRKEYLASTVNGKQYCSLGGVLSNTTRIKCVFALQTLDYSSVQYVFGGRSSTSSNAKTIGISTSHRLSVGYGNTTNSYDVFVNDTDIHIVDYDKNKVYFDGVLVAQFDERTFSTPVRALMFATSGANTSSFYYGAVKIYRCTVYEGNAITHDFVPVYDSDNDRYGMYDVITESFSRNPSSTALASGEKISTVYNNEKLNNAIIEIEKTKNETNNIRIEMSGQTYVQNEAQRVSNKVHSVQTGQTLTFVACSDLHYAVAVGSSDGVTVKESQDALRDMKDAIIAIAEKTHIDFYACFGDVIYQWQGHEADFDNGVTEMFSVTKLLSEAFKNNPQVRMVGNHDPNCENSQDKEFSAYMMNSFAGIYSEMLKKDETFPYGGYGYHDFERQKVRFIVLNTSFYKQGTDLAQGATVYDIGIDQAYWLCTALDLSDKEDAGEWQIVIGSHVVMDAAYANICRYTAILNAYLNGSTWSFSTRSYDFSGKNAAKLALYLNGHTHAYRFKNLRYLNASGDLQAYLPLANLYIPNALPGRESTSTDGETYSKTADSAESTSFQVITVDFVNKIVYAHHYGAGIDVVMHYEPTTETSLTTELTEPTWASVNDTIATVSDGTVTPVADGYSMIYARSETDNCIEVWNYQSEV